MTNILITTTPTVENRPVREYLGIVSGEAFTYQWRLRDLRFFYFGTKTLDTALDTTYEVGVWRSFKANLHEARDWAIQQMAKAAEELGANAVIGVRIDYKTTDYGYEQDARAMLLIATGTAVRL